MITLLCIGFFLATMVLSIKCTWFIIKIFGKIIGIALCIILFVAIASTCINLIGLALLVVPIALICGIFAIVSVLIP